MDNKIINLVIWAIVLVASSALSVQFNRANVGGVGGGESKNQLVQVFENTFEPSTCEMLHYLAEEHNERTGDGSSFFTRPPNNEKPLTPIEHAIDSALIEMGDKTKRVEYWSRDEYMNIDAHADIDEAFLEDEGTVRCPLVGHVLYLQVKRGLHAPTCVFPNEKLGWGLNEAAAAEAETDSVEKELVIVPAVEGRILRFQGSAMHSVPNPTHRWLLSKQEESQLRKEDAICDEDDGDDGDDWSEEDDIYEDEEDEEIERSVLLFNTWADDKPGPRGVNGDIATGALPEGIELSKEDVEAYLKSQEALILSEWEEEYGENGEHIRCNPVSEWKTVYVEATGTRATQPQQDNHETCELNVSLMGMEQRRLYPKKYVNLIGDKESIETALEEDSKVSILHLVTNH